MKVTIFIFLFYFLSSFTATWYNLEGNITKSGEIFKSDKLTCASNLFPIGTKLKLTNPKNKKSVIVRVNDTGKMNKYVIDLSKKAFLKLDKLEKGRIVIYVKKIK